jgi:hypothetical protein
MPTRLILLPIRVKKAPDCAAAGWTACKLGRPLGQVVLDGLDRLASDGHQTLLVTLADAAHAAHAHVDIGDAQVRAGHPQPGGVQDFEHGAVAKADRCGKVRRLRSLSISSTRRYVGRLLRILAIPDFPWDRR